jgi:pyruvate carboxylase
VQIIGDGSGAVTHLWERECSIQRRYQKVVEIAPSVAVKRGLVKKVIGDAVRMAREVKYFSLGTFEFLVNPGTEEYFFLEINPRLQVEHTVTECISTTDIVKIQLLLAQGARLEDCGLPDPEILPQAHSIQLRITAENVQNDWSLSIGKITSFQFPTGNGVRVDTHLLHGHSTVVSADFDSLIAKVIVTAASWEGVVRKAQRALADTQISGVKTNIDILRGIVAHQDFMDGRCDTQWLERKQGELLQSGREISAGIKSILGPDTSASSNSAVVAAGNTLFRKGDAWSTTLSPPGQTAQQPHHLSISRILTNAFPSSLAAEITYTTPSASTSYTLTLHSTSASAASTTSSHRRADPSDPSHISIPFPGKLVEICVDEGDVVKEGDVVCVVQQMKMELEVRSHRSGVVVWVMDVDDGEDVGEGVLVCIVEGEKSAKL